jgi:hypothetical protein
MVDILGKISDAVTSGLNELQGAVNQISGKESKQQGEARVEAQKTFGYKRLNYPGTLVGDVSKLPYWMTIYILKQELSTFTSGPSNMFAIDPISKGRILGTADINARLGTNLNKNTRQGIGFGRKSKRTQRAIRLYMPDTLSWNYANSYKDASISGIPLMGLAQSISSIPALHTSSTAAAKQGGIAGVLASLTSPAGRAATGAAAEALGKASDQGANFGLSALGIALNPQIDVIYETPELRTFTFDFLFCPRNEADAQTLADIIYELKFHSAPEMLGKGIGIGRYYVPPSEFDIEFSTESMGKISTCVLQNIMIDYAPSGAAFYKNEQPVNTRMVLTFRELEFMTKELIDRGF